MRQDRVPGAAALIHILTIMSHCMSLYCVWAGVVCEGRWVIHRNKECRGKWGIKRETGGGGGMRHYIGKVRILYVCVVVGGVVRG